MNLDVRNLTPIAGTLNRLVLEVYELTEEKPRLITPDALRVKPHLARVISISESDMDGRKPTLKVGDVVLYNSASNPQGKAALPFDGEYIFLTEQDVYGVMNINQS